VKCDNSSCACPNAKSDCTISKSQVIASSEGKVVADGYYIIVRERDGSPTCIVDRTTIDRERPRSNRRRTVDVKCACSKRSCATICIGTGKCKGTRSVITKTTSCCTSISNY